MSSYSWGEPDPDLVEEGKVMCPRCGDFEANVDKTYGVLPCDHCKAQYNGWRENHPGVFVKFPSDEAFATKRAKRKRDRQRRHHAKDLIQPKDKYGNINKDFKKAYGFNPFEEEKKAKKQAKIKAELESQKDAN